MMMERNQTLAQLYQEHEGKVSDKWSRYVAEYDLLFKEKKDSPVRLLEIGVQNGGGLEIWAEYFKNGSKFVGCDIDSACANLRFQDPRISVVVGDANANESLNKILQESACFEIVIEDGSHTSSDTIKSFLKYFPYVVDGGAYIAEDLHASYWQDYEGGLFYSYSSVSFFKRLVDIVNSEHWGAERDPAGILAGFLSKYGLEIQPGILDYIHSIQFINSLCVISKMPPADNKLGSRMVAGKTALVTSAANGLTGSLSIPPSQDLNPWTTPIQPPEENIQAYVEQVQDLTCKNAALEKQLNEVLKSKAWKLAAGLRRLRLLLAPSRSRRERVIRKLSGRKQK